MNINEMRYAADSSSSVTSTPYRAAYMNIAERLQRQREHVVSQRRKYHERERARRAAAREATVREYKIRTKA